MRTDIPGIPSGDLGDRTKHNGFLASGKPACTPSCAELLVLQHLSHDGPFCFTSTEARWLIRDGDERVKVQPRIPPEKDWRNRGPLPEQWKC